MMKHNWLASLLVVAITTFGPPARAEQDLTARLQNVVNTYIAQRGAIEHVSGVALHVDLGKQSPVNVFAGTNGRDGTPISPQTLFQIGSNTKHFTAALVLLLEAEGKLTIDQTVGDWLPQYPEWRDVTIRSLLNMTSDVPNYSETVEIGQIVASDLQYQFTPQQLIGAAQNVNLPTPSGWFYSNTNNILAALIIEAASGMSYKRALQTMILKPFALRDTFYSDGPYPQRVLDRLPVGIYENPDCLLYQPTPCTTSTLAPLLGRDLSDENLSWAGPAGAMISNPVDLGQWVRDLFGLRVLPQKQLDEMTSLVSQKNGLPIEDVSAQDPGAFGLDLGRAYQPAMGGPFWFYQGTTLGFRTIFVYWPQYDLVITASTNSQPPPADDKIAADVVGGAFAVLKDCGLID